MNPLLAHRSTCTLIVLVLWSVLASAQSPQAIPTPQSQDTTGLGERVSLYGGAVSFSPPAGFVKMTEEAIAKKYPELGNVPKVAFSNATGTVSVITNFAEERILRSEQLPQFKEFMISFLDKTIPGINWLKKELVEMNGRSWIHLEYISQRAGSREVHSNVYITSLDTRVLLFNFNSTVDEYEKSSAALQISKGTILVKEP